MVQKFMVEKSGVEKFMVEKSGVERSGVETWGWKVRGWDVLQPGKSVHNLTGHRLKHYQEKHRCSFCPSVFRSLSYLDTHKKAVHEKVPCTECGKLFGAKVMKRHIESAHTPDDQKKCRCEVCGKGFSCNQRLSEHLNIHTGEKPFKCRYCSASFASRGTCAGHERGHTGRGRNIQKFKNEMIYD